MPFLKTEKANLFYSYIQNGTKEVIVLINSLGTSHTIWDEVVENLKGSFNILLFDKRGHGLSSTVEGKISIDDYADDIVAIMNHLSIDKVNMVGLSIGGLITYSMASKYPDRVNKLIFSNTGAKIGSEESWNERIAQVREKGLSSMSNQIVDRWLSKSYMKDNPQFATGMVTMLDRISDLGYIQACEAIREADYNPVLDKIKNSTLFIGGSEDIGTTSDFVKEQAANIKSHNIAIIDGVGHLPCIEAPEEMAKIIQKFLSDQEDLCSLGMKTRRSVLGDVHVDRAEANKTDFDKDFQEYIVKSAWGSIWSRPQLTKRERSLITLALLASLGHDEELKMHIRACKNTGATASDIKEVLLHTGIYAGVPVTNNAMKIAKAILEEPKEDSK